MNMVVFNVMELQHVHYLIIKFIQLLMLFQQYLQLHVKLVILNQHNMFALLVNKNIHYILLILILNLMNQY